MKRAIALAAAISLASIPVAGATENISLRPNPVHFGQNLKITARGCQSGQDFDARVIVRIKKHGHSVFKKNKPADNDGTTRIIKKITKKIFKEGKYSGKVTCRHQFHSGGKGTFYKESKSFRVKS